MRLVAFEKDRKPTLGVVDGDQVIDLALADPTLPQDLVGLLCAGKPVFARIAEIARTPSAMRLPLAALRVCPPIETAGKYLGLGLNYADHAAEGGFERPESLTVFMRSRTSFVGHGQPIVRPRNSEQLDYEAELAVIIGRQARHVRPEEALDYVGGYSCFNDTSVRDYQFHTTQWTLGKNFDATGAFGPFFVSADELPPGAAGLRIQARLNGRVLQDSNTSNMIFGVAEAVSLLSECCTLEPGDVVFTGTPAGVGFARKPPLWMKSGDVIEVEIDRIGVLRNPVIDEHGL